MISWGRKAKSKDGTVVAWGDPEKGGRHVEMEIQNHQRCLAEEKGARERGQPRIAHVHTTVLLSLLSIGYQWACHGLSKTGIPRSLLVLVFKLIIFQTQKTTIWYSSLETHTTIQKKHTYRP